jgi:hypothetical protein
MAIAKSSIKMPIGNFCSNLTLEIEGEGTLRGIRRRGFNFLSSECPFPLDKWEISLQKALPASDEVDKYQNQIVYEVGPLGTSVWIPLCRA